MGVTANLLTDIGSLWALGLVVTILILALVFRDSIRTLVDRGGVKVIRGQTSVEIDPAPRQSERPELPDTETQGEPEAPIDAEGNEAPEPSPADGEPDGEPGFLEVFVLLGDKKIDEARVLFETLQDETHDSEERLRDQAYFARARRELAQDSTALSELQELSEDERVRSLALGLLAEAYRDEGLNEKALELSRQAVEAAKRPNDRSAAVIGVADSLLALGERTEATQELTAGIAAADTGGQRLAYYERLGRIFWEDGQWLDSALAYECALEISPSDAARRFNAGYAYAQFGDDVLAAAHYRAALRINSDHHSSRNNAGVAYERLDLPIHSVEAYKRAADAGEGLAKANLGLSFLRAGFALEAKDVLEEAVAQENPHPNAATHLAKVTRNREDEVEKLDKLLDDGAKKQAFLRRFGMARFSGLPSPDIDGTWVDQNGRTMEITNVDGAFVGSTMAADKPASYEGDIQHGSLSFVYRVEDLNLSKSGLVRELMTKGEGRGIVTEDEMELKVREGSSERTEVWRRCQERDGSGPEKAEEAGKT